jgi:hypothetical protein
MYLDHAEPAELCERGGFRELVDEHFDDLFSRGERMAAFLVSVLDGAIYRVPVHQRRESVAAGMG